MKKFKLYEMFELPDQNNCDQKSEKYRIVTQQSEDYESSQGTIVGKVCRVNDNGSEAESQFTNVINLGNNTSVHDSS